MDTTLFALAFLAGVTPFSVWLVFTLSGERTRHTRFVQARESGRRLANDAAPSGDTRLGELDRRRVA